ncbi:hypothetical protein EDB89DRAFT_2016044, partial [Lactarius sanguifluus]
MTFSLFPTLPARLLLFRLHASTTGVTCLWKSKNFQSLTPFSAVPVRLLLSNLQASGHTLQEFTPTDWLLSSPRSDEARSLEARGNLSNRPFFLSFAIVIIVFVQRNDKDFPSPRQASRASPCKTFDPALRCMEPTYLVPRKSGPDRTATW